MFFIMSVQPSKLYSTKYTIQGNVPANTRLFATLKTLNIPLLVYIFAYLFYFSLCLFTSFLAQCSHLPLI